ncbi:MAG: hypothetical protein RL734_322 [Bacteroidota bacterium]|jgi:hypothetical protein
MPHQYNMGLTPEGSFINDVNLQNWTCPAKSVRASEKKLAHYCECDVIRTLNLHFMKATYHLKSCL